MLGVWYVAFGCVWLCCVSFCCIVVGVVGMGEVRCSLLSRLQVFFWHLQLRTYELMTELTRPTAYFFHYVSRNLNMRSLY